MTQSKNYLYTQGELIKSTPIAAGVVDNAPIRLFRTFTNVDNLVGYVKNNLNVTIGKKDDIITVSFDSPYPAEAAQIVNAVVDSYIGYHSTRKRSTVSEVLKILQKEKVKRDKELSDKLKQILEFTRTNGAVSFDNKGGHTVFQRLAKLSDALTQAQLATINAKADLQATQNLASDPAKVKQFASLEPTAGVRIFVNDEETQLRSELKDLEVELKNARLHCTEEHPSIQAIHAKIDHTRKQLQSQAKKFAEAYLEVMRLRWKTAKQREDELLASFNTQRQASQDISVKATEYSVLQAELRRTERFCEILDDRIKELNVTEDVGALNISILEVARPANKPSKPQKAKVMAIALALGLMFGFGFALLRDWLDYRLRSVEEISAILGIPVLGVVPTMSKEQTVVARGQKICLEFKSLVAEAYRTIRTAVFSGVPKSESKTAVVTSPKPRLGLGSPAPGDDKAALKKQAIVANGQRVRLESRSLAAEAYRTIRTAVFFGVPKGEAKTIVITSPAPGDGKSTLASNLAITMAQAGQKTIILDCDFRKPMQHNIFEIDNKKGLSSVLTGVTSPGGNQTITLDEAIRHDLVEGLDVLTCGPEVPNPSEILNSDAFIETLKDLSERYDRVIIDSPPVTPLADSQILGAICDITLLILRAEKSTRKLSQQARDSLLSVGAHVLGAVVNDVSQKGGRYGYYAGYRYYRYGYYGYGHREKKNQYQQKVYA